MLPNKTEETMFAEINPMVIIWIAFCAFIGKFAIKSFTNFNGFCCVSFTFVTDMIVEVFYFQSCFRFRNNFAFFYIGCFVVTTNGDDNDDGKQNNYVLYEIDNFLFHCFIYLSFFKLSRPY